MHCAEIQRGGVPEVNAVLLTLKHPSPDEDRHCLIWRKKENLVLGQFLGIVFLQQSFGNGFVQDESD